ncbi:MAG: GNAT family N-acetyltransferase [Flavobacterium sp. JAD_PAG50586_2]|nr:MAG: GNAT family N-acetyltransferase [Flavobacterium sp. JAD_PAG50586_2]
MMEIKEILKNGMYRRISVVHGNRNTMSSRDESSTTQHFGLFNDDLIGIISLFENRNPIFQDSVQVQLRGLDILEDYECLRLRERLIKNCEKSLKSKKDNLLIWFNANKTAVSLYEKLGYRTVGDVFKIKGIGEHFIMFKKLDV